MAAHLTRSDDEGSNAMDGTDDILWWNDSEEDGDARSEWREDEGKLERVTQVHKIWHTLCIKCKQLIIKYFLSTHYFWGVILHLDIYIFP